jgi:serine/threonine protein kinase
LCGFAQDDRYLYFSLEYIAGGELFTYLRTEGRLPLEQARYFLFSILKVLLGAGLLNV